MEKVLTDLDLLFAAPSDGSNTRQYLCEGDHATMVDWMLCELIVDYDSLAIDHPKNYPNVFKYAIRMTQKYPIIADNKDRFNKQVFTLQNIGIHEGKFIINTMNYRR